MQFRFATDGQGNTLGRCGDDPLAGHVVYRANHPSDRLEAGNAPSKLSSVALSREFKGDPLYRIREWDRSCKKVPGDRIWARCLWRQGQPPSFVIVPGAKLVQFPVRYFALMVAVSLCCFGSVTLFRCLLVGDMGSRGPNRPTLTAAMAFRSRHRGTGTFIHDSRDCTECSDCNHLVGVSIPVDLEVRISTSARPRKDGKTLQFAGLGGSLIPGIKTGPFNQIG